MSLAEKFQITLPPQKEDEKWVTFASARHTEHCQEPCDGEAFNKMPKTQLHGQNEFTHGFGGDTDVSGGVTPKSLGQGFQRREMKATDDQYHGEHCDLFYGEAKDELGNVGFVERNNYLDRV